MEYKYSTSNNNGKTYDIEFSAANIPKDVAEPIMASIRRNIAKLEELNAPVEVVDKVCTPEEKVQNFKESTPDPECNAFSGEPSVSGSLGASYVDPILKR